MAYRWLCVVSLALVLVTACGEENSPRVFVGTGATGGDGGAGGIGGVGGITLPEPLECETSQLCKACPPAPTCEGDSDCSTGFVCIETGCAHLDGAGIRKCVFAGGGACNDDSDCSSDRRCTEVEGEANPRCIRTSPGCSATSDCVLGFECEAGACVDRRVPCDVDPDCPKNHVCYGGSVNSEFCLRIQVDCDTDRDCDGRAPHCVDIDGDERTECAGWISNNPASGACTNDLCSDSAPVCEASGVFSVSPCGSYGLCEKPEDCLEGYVCAALWPDGRKECVLAGGTCSSFEDCDPNQVCASPRGGGPPACQVGALDGGQ